MILLLILGTYDLHSHSTALLALVARGSSDYSFLKGERET
jgi:hypothetical protein